MKYTFKIIIFVSLLFSLNTYANFEYSLKAGTTYSKVGVKNTDTVTKIDINYKLGFALFLSMKKDIKNNFYFNFNLGMNQKGGAFKITDVDTRKAHSYDRSYFTIETPFIIGYNFFENISLYFGAYFSLVFLITGPYGSQYGIYNGEGNLRNDIGFLLGLRYIYDKLSFEFMFEHGSGKLVPEVSEAPGYTSNSRQFIFMFGYTFF